MRKSFPLADDHISSGTHSQPGCGEFRGHAAGSHVAAARVLSHFQKILIQLVNLIDELRLRIRMGIIGEKAVDVG